MVSATDGQIVKNWKPLGDEHLPGRFPGRERQREQLLEVIQSASRGQGGRVWVYGPPGTGKSSVVRDVLNAAENMGLRTVFLNCFWHATFFACVDGALNELRALVGDTRDTAFKFERLARIAGKEKIVIALDEADLMYAAQRNAALYNFCALPQATIICISNKREDIHTLDARVRSRLQPLFIECLPYRATELLQILEERAEASLKPRSWKSQDLELLAEESEGDARMAITALRSAAIAAEKDKASVLRQEDLRHGILVAHELRREYVLKDLSEQHRLIHQLVVEAGEISRTELWNRYRARAPEVRLPVMSHRTVNFYVNYLLRSGLIEEVQGGGRGNSRLLRGVRP